MNLIQDLPKCAPYFGAPKALRRQNHEMMSLLLKGASPPDGAFEIVDRFWNIYDSTPGQMGDKLTRREIGKLTWCFALERNRRQIIKDVNATLLLLSLIQRGYRRSYLPGLMYSFLAGYNPKSSAFELFRTALRQMATRPDSANRREDWQEILSHESHTALARRIISENIPYSAITQQLNVPQSSSFYRHICVGLIDAIISLRRVKDKLRPLLDFLTETGDLDAIKHTVEKALLYYHAVDFSQIDLALINFAEVYLGDCRHANAPHWVGLDKNAQAIFGRWLSAIDLQRFFGEIDRDEERKAFWLEYLNSVEYTRMVLGERFNGETPYAELVNGAAHDNALILQVGELVVVELSGKEKLRYVYEARSVPFALNAQSYEYADLFNESALFRQHLTEGWQKDFASVLHDHFGIYRHQSRREASTTHHHQQMWRRRAVETDFIERVHA